MRKASLAPLDATRYSATDVTKKYGRKGNNESHERTEHPEERLPLHP